jgi:hypothetical protein
MNRYPRSCVGDRSAVVADSGRCRWFLSQPLSLPLIPDAAYRFRLDERSSIQYRVKLFP